MKNSLSYYLGNALIIFSLLGLAYVIGPVIFVYLSPPPTSSSVSHKFGLWIPKIHASGEIIANVDPFNKTEYIKALKKGIALAKGFALPGEQGVTFLFAHSSGLPWELTHYNTVFLRLGELDKGDEVIIWYKSKEFRYKVTSKKVVNPTDIKAVTEEKTNELIIQTCTPIGTDWQRLLIYAKLIN